MMNHTDFVLPELSKWHKQRMLGYASQVLQAQQQMTTSKGKNLLHYTLKKKRKHIQMSHYPKGDRIDRTTGAQYFYHCHRENYESHEHGHFHCFLRYKQIPKDIKPAPLDDWNIYFDNPMTHLVAIAMNQFGLPIRLFSVNRWVTSEVWYEAKHLPRFIKRYKMTLQDDPYWQVLDKWVEGMLHLFAPQIAWLQQAGDRKILQHKESGVENPFLDFDLEELAEIEIDLKKQVEWLIS